jgi:hypothetical protein
MSGFYGFYNNLDVDKGLLIMLMVMSVFVAIFHTLITIGLYEINLKPKWLFCSESFINLAQFAL